MGFNEFEGDVVRLRAIEPEDWEVFNGFDLDTQLARLCGSTHLPASKASSREWAEECSKRRNSDEGFLVIETLDGTVIGSLNVVRADRRNRVFRYGLGLHRQFWRKGYGTEAVNLLLRFYFGELGYHKVEIDVYGYNDASVAFHEQLGFQQEGRRRMSHFAKGEYHDIVLMGDDSRRIRQAIAARAFVCRHGLGRHGNQSGHSERLRRSGDERAVRSVAMSVQTREGSSTPRSAVVSGRGGRRAQD